MAIFTVITNTWLKKLAFFALLIGWFTFAGCSRANLTPSAEPLDPTRTTAAPTEFLETDIPTPTAEAKTVVLLALAGSDLDMKSEMEGVLGELAASSGMNLETWSELPQLEMGADVRLAVLLPPDPGAANLSAANPQVQFLAVGIDGINVGSNLSLISSEKNRPDQQGFLAGYLAAVITQDWRVGVISRADTPQGSAARLGFLNGAVFFCGLCRPVYPPFIQYPQYIELAGGYGEPELRAAADQLLANAVKTVFIAPEVDDSFLVDYLAEAGVSVIGTASPKDSLRPRWVATIEVDLADSINTLWPKLLRGEGGISESARLTLSDVNEELLSRGRMRLVEKTLIDLLAGMVDTGVDPQTGQLR